MSAPNGKEKDSVKVRFAKDGLGDMDTALAYFRGEREAAAAARGGHLPDLGFDGDMGSIAPLMPRKKYWQRDAEADAEAVSTSMQTAAVDNLVESMMQNSSDSVELAAPQKSAQFDLIT